MKSILVIISLVVCAVSAELCSDSTRQFCSAAPKDNIADLKECNAKYSAIDAVESKLQAYANKHITHSFDFLLMSTYFGNFEKDRVGFSQLFRKLSDAAWNDAVDLIKYLGKRGGKMVFDTQQPSIKTVEQNEIDSMGFALDTQKKLAVGAHTIHKEVTRLREEHHDPEVGSFLENHFVHKQAQTVRDLSGHVNDLKRLMYNKDTGKKNAVNKDISLALFLFDEYLQKL